MYFTWIDRVPKRLGTRELSISSPDWTPVDSLEMFCSSVRLVPASVVCVLNCLAMLASSLDTMHYIIHALQNHHQSDKSRSPTGRVLQDAALIERSSRNHAAKGARAEAGFNSINSMQQHVTGCMFVIFFTGIDQWQDSLAISIFSCIRIVIPILLPSSLISNSTKPPRNHIAPSCLLTTCLVNVYIPKTSYTLS